MTEERYPAFGSLAGCLRCLRCRFRGKGARGLHKSFPEPLELGGGGVEPLRVALHGHQPATAGSLEAFDQAAVLAVGPGGGYQAACQEILAHGLVMEGIDGQRRPPRAVARAVADERSAENGFGVDLDAMHLRWPAAEGSAGVARNILQQRATREDVDRLKPATDAQDRHVASLGLAPGRQFELVADRLYALGSLGGFAVQSRFQVRSTREQQPRHPSQKPLALGGWNAGVEQCRRGAVTAYS